MALSKEELCANNIVCALNKVKIAQEPKFRITLILKYFYGHMTLKISFFVVIISSLFCYLLYNFNDNDQRSTPDVSTFLWIWRDPLHLLAWHLFLLLYLLLLMASSLPLLSYNLLDSVSQLLLRREKMTTIIKLLMMSGPLQSCFLPMTTELGAGLQVLTVWQEKGAVQTGQLPAVPGPRGVGRASQLVSRHHQHSLRTNPSPPES